MNNNNNIILHIPKTGGTTLLMNLLNTDRPPIPSKNYRHIINSKTGESNCGELFENYNYYKNINIIMFIRNPIERLESEFSFLRNRIEFLELWNNDFPSDFLEYSKNNKTYNSICKFLLGIKLYEYHEIKQEDYDNLINKIKQMNFIYCITEKYNESLSLIENRLKININNNIINYRENLNKLKRKNWEEIEYEFNKNNYYDIKLYEYCLKKFNTDLNIIKKNKKFNFTENKYHSLFIYCNKPIDRCPISIFNINSKFVENNNLQLKIINELSRKKCKNGIDFALQWLILFKKHFKIDISINNNEPLETIKEISRIDRFN